MKDSLTMNYKEFQKFLKKNNETIDDAYRCIYLENKETIRIKKEKTAIKNLKRIMDAVFKITYEKGFYAMTIRDLSTESGISIGALYPYFRSKEDLLTILLRQGLSYVIRVLDKISQQYDDPVLKLESVIKAHLFLSEKARLWFYLMFMESKNLNPPEWKIVLKAENQTEKVIVEILQDGESFGVFKKQNHLLTASIIKAMQQEWYLKRWKYSKRKISVDAYAEYVLEFVKSFCLAAS